MGNPRACRSATDRDIGGPAANIFVTAEAMVPIKAIVKDNLAIRRIVLAYSHADQAKQAEQTVEFYLGPEKAEPAVGETMTTATGETKTIEERWDLRLSNLRRVRSYSFTLMPTIISPKRAPALCESCQSSPPRNWRSVWRPAR